MSAKPSDWYYPRLAAAHVREARERGAAHRQPGVNIFLKRGSEMQEREEWVHALADLLRWVRQ